MFRTGWDFHYGQPVPRFVGLIVIFIGLGVFVYEVWILLKK